MAIIALAMLATQVSAANLGVTVHHQCEDNGSDCPMVCHEMLTRAGPTPAPPPPDMKKKSKAIPFRNNKGAEMLIPGHLTLRDLAAMGMRQIRLEPKGGPLPDNWWCNAESSSRPDLPLAPNSRL